MHLEYDTRRTDQHIGVSFQSAERSTCRGNLMNSLKTVTLSLLINWASEGTITLCHKRLRHQPKVHRQNLVKFSVFSRQGGNPNCPHVLTEGSFIPHSPSQEALGRRPGASVLGSLRTFSVGLIHPAWEILCDTMILPSIPVSSMSSLNTHFRKKSVLCNSSRLISLSRCPTNKECGEEQGTPETGPRWCCKRLPACRWGWQSSLLRATHPWFSWELREDGSGCSLRAPWTPSLSAAGKLETGSYKRRRCTLHRVPLELPCLQLAQTQGPLHSPELCIFARFVQSSRTAIFSVLSF